MARLLNLQHLARGSYASRSDCWTCPCSSTGLVAAFRNREFGSDSLAVIAISCDSPNQRVACCQRYFSNAGNRTSFRDLGSGSSKKSVWSRYWKEHLEPQTLLKATPRLRKSQLTRFKVGDRVLVRSGEVVPVDGKMASALEPLMPQR